MSQKTHYMHGRDHQPGGADPIPNWPAGGGGLYPWAYGLFSGVNVIPNATPTYTYFNLNPFYTDDAATFGQGTLSSLSGITIKRAGLYRLSFHVWLVRSSGETTPETKPAKLAYTGGGSSQTVSTWAPGPVDAVGVHTFGTPSRATWELHNTVLWNYPTGATYPSPRITVGAAHNASGNATAYGGVVIERLSDDVPGGIS